jgi:prepilin-type N-terminal cleavage/methylation domain-containing protein
LLAMRRGFSLAELAVTVALLGLVTAVTLPRLRGFTDWVILDAMARDVTTALAVARHSAVTRASRARLLIARDSLRVDLWNQAAWVPLVRWAGPACRGVELEISNAEIVFGPTGVGWGATNTKAVLRRASRVETVTISRVGRVKRW